MNHPVWIFLGGMAAGVLLTVAVVVGLMIRGWTVERRYPGRGP